MIRRVLTVLLLAVLVSCRSASTDGTDIPIPETPNPTEAPMNLEEALFPAVPDRAFNRMTFRYRSAGPVKLKVVYTVLGEPVEDAFYLEAGEEMTFSALIEPYLRQKSASDLRFDSLTPLDDTPLDARILSAELESLPVYSRDVYYLEGTRFTLGIKLSWGGGISVLRDAKNPIPGMDSLINCADTGRLIQQSYYGTPGNAEYTPGFFNNSNWVYNPVQGGNMYNQPSRLIDLTVEENRVTVKAQPMDWSSRRFLTPSYMENTYTLTEDYVRIDNRFVDFSGWDNGVTSQEVPAFYTVSYLDAYVRYHGSASWTGDALTWERDLPFWGDPATHERCVFPQAPGQTETWSAWVSEAENYGIGLYVPGTSLLLAGRYAYNGSKDPANGATNYIAPVEYFSIRSFRPAEYSSMITAGSVEEIRAVFAANRDFAENRWPE